MQTPTDIQFRKEKKTRVCVHIERAQKKLHSTLCLPFQVILDVCMEQWDTFPFTFCSPSRNCTHYFPVFFCATGFFCSLNRVWERDRALIERGFFFVFFIKMIWWVASHRRILIKRLIEIADFLGCFKRQVNYTYRRLIYTLSARNCLGIVRLWLLLLLLLVNESEKMLLTA